MLIALIFFHQKKELYFLLDHLKKANIKYENFHYNYKQVGIVATNGHLPEIEELLFL